MTEAIQAPNPTGLFGEARGLLEFPKLLIRFPELARQPRGNGQRVMVLPGYGASDTSTAVLRAYIGYLGYAPVGWGLGRNNGEVPDLIPRVVERIEELVHEAGRPIDLIGWSLGGYLAREAARERPQAVQQVVTLGSPVVGGPKYTAVARSYRRRGIDLDEIEAEVAARNSQPLETSITAIYSRTDSVVAWQACIDHHSPKVDHIEVETTHLGLGFSPQVFQIIAERLALEGTSS
jgi:pimeloyl-ACP methyl ester carboxylesterase